jgi:hypothetical protein
LFDLKFNRNPIPRAGELQIQHTRSEMCTIVLLLRPGLAWPVLVAANRDEMQDRAWDPPGRHWPDRPDVIAGRDRLAGGSWLGLNDHGVMAAMLNRAGTLGPQTGKRSRGELVLDALDYADADEAARALAELAPDSYRAFNMVILDNRDAFWLRNDEHSISLAKLPPGLSLITSLERNDPASPRIARYLPLFAAAPVPEPEKGDWEGWIPLLAETRPDRPREGMNIVTDTGYGTVSSALIALPQAATDTRRPIFLFAAGRPGEAPYRPVGPGLN